MEGRRMGTGRSLPSFTLIGEARGPRREATTSCVDAGPEMFPVSRTHLVFFVQQTTRREVKACVRYEVPTESDTRPLSLCFSVGGGTLRFACWWLLRRCMRRARTLMSKVAAIGIGGAGAHATGKGPPPGPCRFLAHPPRLLLSEFGLRTCHSSLQPWCYSQARRDAKIQPAIIPPEHCKRSLQAAGVRVSFPGTSLITKTLGVQTKTISWKPGTAVINRRAAILRCTGW